MNTNNGDMPARPTFVAPNFDGGFVYGEYGLTKREHFAAMMMQGLISAWGQHDVTDFGEIASDAAMAADALLKELAK